MLGRAARYLSLLTMSWGALSFTIRAKEVILLWQLEAFKTWRSPDRGATPWVASLLVSNVRLWAFLTLQKGPLLRRGPCHVRFSK